MLGNSACIYATVILVNQTIGGYVWSFANTARLTYPRSTERGHSHSAWSRPWIADAADGVSELAALELFRGSDRKVSIRMQSATDWLAYPVVYHSRRSTSIG